MKILEGIKLFGYLSLHVFIPALLCLGVFCWLCTVLDSGYQTVYVTRTATHKWETWAQPSRHWFSEGADIYLNSGQTISTQEPVTITTYEKKVKR